MAGADFDLCIAGGGPAGMVAGLLFARAGVSTLVVEKHSDFLRDFRGDTVHPSTLTVFHELGLLDALLKLPHQKLRQLGGRIAGRTFKLVDFRALPGPAPYIALMPQWDLLDFIAREARRYPCFTLRQDCEAAGLIEGEGRVAGIQLAGGGEVRARLAIAADGRHSVLRKASGLPLEELGAPMDVFWFRIAKTFQPDSETLGVFAPGKVIVFIDRGDYYQCAFVFAKGSADSVRGEGIELFRERVRSAAPDIAGGVDSVRSWDDVKLLTVSINRLREWSRPGLLVIGDAAHAMSPMGGVGINLAVQDAVAAANLLAGPMAAGADPDPLLPRLQERRMKPTRRTQRLQIAMQNRVVAPLLRPEARLDKPPLAARLFDALPLLRRIPGRIIGLGFQPEHVRSPSA